MYHSRSPTARGERESKRMRFGAAHSHWCGMGRRPVEGARSGAQFALRSRGSRLSVSGHAVGADRPHRMSTVEIGLLPCAVRTEVPGVGVPPAAPNWTGANERAIEEDEPAPPPHGTAHAA